MEIEFMPIDYDYFDYKDKTYAKIIGRNKSGKRIACIDECDVFFWAILKSGISESKTREIEDKIKRVWIKEGSKTAKVIKTEIHNKNFLGNKVKAVKIFVSNFKYLKQIAEQINYQEIEKIKEHDLHFITRYILEKKLSPLSLYKIRGEALNNSEECGGIDSQLEVDLCIKINNIEKKDSYEYTPKVLAFDIETDDFEIGKGKILMISMVSDNFKKVLSYGEFKSLPDFVECCKDEKEMIESFARYFNKISPDILTGYFSDSFDLPYLKARAEKNKIKLNLGIDGSAPKFSGGVMPRGKINGIVHVDLYKFIETAYSQYLQSETLGLNEVANELLGERKIDFEFKESSKLEKSDWIKFFEYNLHDSVLTYKLFSKAWPDMMEFSRIMHEPLFNVSRDGMSANVENYIIHNLEKYNEIIEQKPDHEEISKRRMRGKYEGAFVLQPIPKLYENIVMFDFTSYWPSIIATFNLSLSTFLGEKKHENSLEVELEKEKRKLYFSKTKGFFPEMLGEIIKKRKEYKEEYKKNPSPILKARSNAFKLLANASYGYQGFFGARYYCPEASAATTAISRKFIKEIIEKFEKQGFKAIYSDSVNGKTKVIIRKNNIVFEEEIEKLFEETQLKSISGKEYDYKKNIEVLTLDENGKSVFKPIVYVMRHKCSKKMYRVNFTNNWHIDVTEDHSLIGYQSSKFSQSSKLLKNSIKRLIEVKPTEINNKANTIIALKKIPYEHKKSRDYPKEVYEFMGYFIGDGSFQRNNSHKKYNKDYYLRLSLGKDTSEIFNKLIEPLMEKGYIKNYWWSKSREGDITINGLKLINIISKDFNKNGKKIIPDWIFEESEENISSFLRGLFSADGCVMIRNNAPIIKYTSINNDYIMSVRKLLYRVGIAHSVFKENSVNKYKTKNKVYSSGSHSLNIILKDREIFAENIGFILERKNKLAQIKKNNLRTKLIKSFDFNLQGVIGIKEIENSDYVYDLEVEDTHRFFANYILAHNTDSICLEIGKKTKSQALEFLHKINSDLPGIMELELEDFYKRGIWVTTRKGEFGAKKKYALINNEGKMKIRGFETVRRDWCNLARELQNNVLHKILKEGNEKSALQYTKEIIEKVKSRKVDKKELIIRTQLKKPISEYIANTPHVTIARKMIEKGMPVDQGMLIQYYIAESENKKAITRDRAAFPEDKKPYDIEYYLKKQVLPAVENIFMVFNIDSSQFIEAKKQKKLNEF